MGFLEKLLRVAGSGHHSKSGYRHGHGRSREPACAAPTEVARCTACTEPLLPNARFCAKCGVSLTPRACAACKAPLAIGARFCGSCGVTVAA
tara:strand:- start:5047 stop:5322 length:276 start_codon:yes stop_codon:yes gene_type:complete